MQSTADVTTVAHVIQQAAASVFLLAGIGTMLNVISSPFARIVDHSRIQANKDGQTDLGNKRKWQC
jgi:hypothetical protein